MYEYPRQIENAFTQSRDRLVTFGLENWLAAEQGEIESDKKCDTNPLELHPGYSRFKMVLISKNGSTTTVTANIPAVDDADEIIEKSRAVLPLIMQAKTQDGSGETAESGSLCNTQLKLGKFKGCTPLQILRSDPGKRQELEAQAVFLEERMQQYPENREQAAAIRQALDMYDEGTLPVSRSVTVKQEEFSVYKAEYKPLRSSLSEDGKTIMVYSVDIRCIPANKYPFQLTIRNEYATWDGETAHTSPSDRTDEVRMVFSERKWLGIVNKMRRQLDAFETYNFGRQYQKAMAAEKFNSGTVNDGGRT